MRYTFQVVIAVVGFMTVAVASVGDTYAAAAAGKNAVPRVVDANNKLVGEVIGNDQSSLNPLVVLNISTPLIIVSVSRSTFFGNKNLYFTGANCSGQAFFGAEEVAVSDPMYTYVGALGSVIYGVQPNAGAVAFTYNSFAPAFQSNCSSSQGDYNGVVAAPIIDLSTQFTPPYRFVYP